MKNVITVTLHRAENYGSILQSYALQEFVKKLGQDNGVDIKYQILDVRPKMQERIYSIYKSGWNLSSAVKNCVAFFNYRKLKRKKEKFSSFAKELLCLTERYQDEQAPQEEQIDAQYYISGSDQVWNVRSQDFEDYFYLDFVKNGRKISYAASFGPLKIDWTKYNRDKYRNFLNAYDYISTREEGSAKNIELLTEKKAEIHIDPTLLLDKEDWRKIQSAVNYKQGKYILLYCLEPSKEQLKIVKAISKKLHLPVVITKYNNKNDIFNTFVKKYDSGPQDFLALIDNAALVITSSFHGKAFSLIYRKKFYVLNGKMDNRISDILEKTSLLERSIERFTDIEKVNLGEIDFSVAETFLANQKNRSEAYLKRALEF